MANQQGATITVHWCVHYRRESLRIAMKISNSTTG